MRINVAQLLKAPVGATRHYDIDDEVDLTDNGDIRKVRGEVTLLHTDRGILADGVFNTDIELDCSRCLTTYKCPLNLHIQEEFFPTIDIVTGTSVGLPEDQSGGFTIDKHNEINLAEAVRQYAIMALPMKPLCREDCAGICPTCGCNLNEKRCSCSQERIDPRWQQLIEKVHEKGIY